MSLKILLIMDDTVGAEAAQQALAGPANRLFQVERVRSCTEGLARLIISGQQAAHHSARIAAVMTDLFLPDSHGIECVDRLIQAAPQIPLLILCGPQDEHIARLAIRRGAQDYLLKHQLDNYWVQKTLHNMIVRTAHAGALSEERERTLNSIGDAVISIDTHSHVTFLNAVAENLTGWSRQEAAGHQVEKVLRIIDATTREVAPNPMSLAIRDNTAVALTPNCVLVRRDGGESAIEDSATPIHDRYGQVTGAVMVFRDVSKARTLARRMSHLAQHDSLTDLPNRTLLHDRLAHAIALAHRHQQQLAVLFLDLDHFKNINDSLGHAIGDLLLQAVALRLIACVRSSDSVGRLGGDEFVIVLSEVTHADDAIACAGKILEAVSTAYRIDHRRLRITASIGIATYPDDGADAETLLKHADLAMYYAKNTGRGNYHRFTVDINAPAIEQKMLSSGGNATARRQFMPDY